METSSVPSTNASVGVLNNNINNTTTSNNNGGGGGGGANNSTFDSLKSNENNNFINGNKNSPPGPQSGQQSSQQQYTIPGILHFLQYEWQRFELERQQWDIERAELQARIALLQGERKGQENLKSDLVRRIKMLEYCLRQERAKYHKLKYGVDPPSLGADDAPQLNNDPLLEDSIMNSDMGTGSGALGVNWKHGRQLLRQYLQEIGYTDTIIDVRSNRVRSLLGLNNATPSEDGLNDHGKGVTQTQARSPRIKQQQSPASSIVADAEASVLATFEFLNEQSRDHARNSSGNEDDEDEEDDEEMADDVDTNAGRGSFPIDTETEEVLAEFDFLSAHPAGEQKDGSGWGSGNSKSDIVDIGELAALTVANESLDVNGSNTDTMRQRYDNRRTESSEFRKTWNPRYILKSHFDCVRCLRFHQTEPLLVTCSEDETLKLWNLNKTQQSNKGKQATSAGGTTFDLEPIYTYRGHTSRVLSLTLSNNIIYSGAQNGELFIWSIPSNISTIDPYDAYDASLSVGTLEGHTDAIWSLVVLSASNTTNLLLCSASADSTVRIWDASKKLCIKTITLDDALPTCLANIPPHNNNTTSANSAALLALSLSNGAIFVYDIESASYSQPILTFEDGGATSRINSIVVHPTMPVIVSAHEDRQIKFWDLNSGKCVHSMVAHLDEVTCLACDPNGLYLLSGSHDCSIRLWNFDNRTCVQEITSHRKKFDEAIFDVTFHLSKPYFASAGADGLAKVFV